MPLVCPAPISSDNSAERSNLAVGTGPSRINNPCYGPFRAARSGANQANGSADPSSSYMVQYGVRNCFRARMSVKLTVLSQQKNQS